MHARRALVIVFSCVLASAGGCVFSPTIKDGQVRCASDDSCPPGFQCGGDGLCHDGAARDGGSGGGDLAGCMPSRVCQIGSCGSPDDGCGTALHCGDCTTANSCSVNSAYSCACTPVTCDQVHATCGVYPDGCGGVLDCFPDAGTCAAQKNGSCGGGGPYTCGKGNNCKAKTCGQGSCGTQPDGCNGQLKCGDCPTGQICGGGGVANVCG